MEVKLLPKEGNSPWQESIKTRIYGGERWWMGDPVTTIKLAKVGSIVSIRIEGCTHYEPMVGSKVGQFTNTCLGGLSLVSRLPPKYRPYCTRTATIRLAGCNKPTGQILIGKDGQIIISSDVQQSLDSKGFVVQAPVHRFERISRANPHGFWSFATDFIAASAEYVPSKDEMDNLRELVALSGAKIDSLETLVREQGTLVREQGIIIARLQSELKTNPKSGGLVRAPEAQTEGVAREPGAPD